MLPRKQLILGFLAIELAILLVKLLGLQAATMNKLDAAQAMAWQTLPLFTLPKPDPLAEAVRDQYLKTWAAKGGLTANQGIWMQSDMTVLAQHQGKTPLPAASLTKIATTLAALHQWGPSYQFETFISATGEIDKGVLQGDLVITGGGDPLFVWEEAIAVANTLNQRGIHRITGNVIIIGDFYLDFQENPTLAGQLFKQALNSSTWSRPITLSYSRMTPGTPKPKVEVAGGVKVATSPPPGTFLLFTHQSPSLTQILREMNIYSNNALADMLGTAAGGAKTVSQIAVESARIPQNEIQLINTSGLGVENRISPRAVTAMLMAIEKFLAPYQMTVEDVFPLAGRDHHGTLRGRKIPVGTAIKTGTLREVSALAGVMPTRDRGLVWFAIINRGNNIWEFRSQQDQFLEKLSQQWGNFPGLQPHTTQPPALLGDLKRIQ